MSEETYDIVPPPSDFAIYAPTDDDLRKATTFLRRIFPDGQKIDEAAIIVAAQTCAYFTLVPSRDVHCIRFGGDWVVDVGVSAFEKFNQRRQRETGSVVGVIREERLTEDECREYLGAQYDEDKTVGVRLYMADSTLASIPGYEPMAFVGFHYGAKHIMKRNGQWIPDRRVDQETPHEQARRRALKKGLRRMVGFWELSTQQPQERWQVMERNLESLTDDIEHQKTEEETLRPDRQHNRQEDGDILFATDDEEGVWFPLPPFPEAETEDELVSWAAKEWQCPQGLSKVVEYLRSLQGQSTKPMTKAGYGKLVGGVNQYTEDETVRRMVLAAVVGRPVDRENRPGNAWEATTPIKPHLMLYSTYTDKETKEKAPNPDYNSTAADAFEQLARIFEDVYEEWKAQS